MEREVEAGEGLFGGRGGGGRLLGEAGDGGTCERGSYDDSEDAGVPGRSGSRCFDHAWISMRGCVRCRKAFAGGASEISGDPVLVSLR